MKHLFFALAIALLTSSVAATAWSQQTEPTEQETKDFIVDTMSKCGDVKEVKFEGSTLHLSTLEDDNLLIGADSIRSDNHYTVPVQKLKSVEAFHHSFNSVSSILVIKNLIFHCKGADGDCTLIDYVGNNDLKRMSSGITSACPKATQVVLAKAFNHLIGIYDAKRPKPLFE